MFLSPESFKKARTFLLTDARELERVRFLYEFESGSPSLVLDALAKFQNADGGFGNALEPDLRCPESSALATSVALRTLLSLPKPLAMPLIEKTVKWLEANWSEEHQCWPIITEEANSSPRAPWWNWDSATASKSVFNPAADIAAALREHEIDSGLIHKSTSKQIDTLRAAADIEDHDLICLVRQVECKAINDQSLIALIRQAIRDKITKTPDDLANYGLRPRFIISSPSSVFCEDSRTEVDMEMGILITSQAENGSWAPNWSWFGQFNETWLEAEKEWRGAITLDILLWFRAFDRIVC